MIIEKMIFQPSGWVPNNQRFPVLVYGGILPLGASSTYFEAIFGANGWAGIWRNGVFHYQHYHSAAHEVLGIAHGSATLLIGGPEGQPIAVSAGDCLILPAGTGHCNIDSSSDFEVVGAYPEGQHADIQTAAATSDMLAIISALPAPLSDPVQGSSGGLVQCWH